MKLKLPTSVLVAALVVLALGACGGDESSDETTATTAPAATTTETTTEAPSTTTPAPGGASTPGEKELRETLITWYATKDCDLMTDEFLESYDRSARGSRAELCKGFKEDQLTFDPKTIEVTRVQIDGDIGRVAAERKGTSESPSYELVAENGRWLVNGNCRTRPGCMEAFGEE
jgi:hypothetical protein